MRYKIMKTALESVNVGGNPSATTSILPSGDLNLSPSTSIPIEEQELMDFCEKSEGLIDQIHSAEKTAIVLEGIAARLEQSANKAEARATRYAVECLCEDVGIDKADLKGNEEGTDPNDGDKISIVMENITEGLARIWKAIREAVKRYMSWVKAFLKGVFERLTRSKRVIEGLEASYEDYLNEVKSGKNQPLNTEPYIPSERYFKFISGGIGSPTEAPHVHLAEVLQECAAMTACFEKVADALHATCESLSKGGNVGLAFDRFPDMRKVATTEITIRKNGVDGIIPSELTDVYQGINIGYLYSVVYRFTSEKAKLETTDHMAQAIRESMIALVARDTHVKIGPLPALTHDNLVATIEAMRNFDGTMLKMAEVLNRMDSIENMLYDAIQEREKDSNNAENDSPVFSALIGSLDTLILKPGSKLLQFMDSTTLAPEEYFRHALEV